MEAQKRQEDESPVIKMTGSRLSEKVTRFFFFLPSDSDVVTIVQRVHVLDGRAGLSLYVRI